MEAWRMEGGGDGWRMEDGGMEDGLWRMDDGGWRMMEDGGWRDGGWRMESSRRFHGFTGSRFTGISEALKAISLGEG